MRLGLLYFTFEAAQRKGWSSKRRPRLFVCGWSTMNQEKAADLHSRSALPTSASLNSNRFSVLLPASALP